MIFPFTISFHILWDDALKYATNDSSHILYTLTFKISDGWRRMRRAEHVERVGEKRGVYRVLVGKPDGKRPLGRPRRRWEDNIKMGLQEVGCGGMDWIGIGECGNEPSGSTK